MDDEDGRCLLDVICDPQALNDFLHGSEKLDSDDLLDNPGEAQSAFYEGPGLHVQEASGNHLNPEPSQPAPSVDLDFLEDDILGSPAAGGGGGGGADQPCDILQQSLQEANITEQTLEAEAELDLGPFQLPTLQPADGGAGPAGTGGAAAVATGPQALFPGGADLLGLQAPPTVLTHQALVPPQDVVSKALSVQPFLQPVGLGNVTLQPIPGLQGLPNGSPGGAAAATLGLAPIQVVGQPVMALNPPTSQLLAKQVPVSGYLASAAGPSEPVTLASAGVSPQGAGLVIQKNLPAAVATTLNGNSVFGGAGAATAAASGAPSGQPLAVAPGLGTSPLVPAPNVILHRTPTPIQPKPAGVLPPKLYQLTPKPFAPAGATLTIQGEAGGLPQQPKAPQNLTFMAAGKAGQNVVLSGFPAPALQANVFKQPPATTTGGAPPQPPGALSKPMSVHLLNQGSSIVIPAQHMLPGQNQFLLPGTSAVQLPQPLSALPANVGGQILAAAAPHAGGQLIANPILTNQNLAGPLSLGPVLAPHSGAHSAAHILSAAPIQVGQPALFQMPVSLAAGSLPTQSQPAPTGPAATTVLQGVTLPPSAVAMLNAPDGLVQPATPAAAAAGEAAPVLAVQTAPQASPAVSTPLPLGLQQPQAQQQQQPAQGPAPQAAPAQASTPQPSPGLASSPEKMVLGQPPSAAATAILTQDSLQMFLPQERSQQPLSTEGPHLSVPASVIVSAPPPAQDPALTTPVTKGAGLGPQAPDSQASPAPAPQMVATPFPALPQPKALLERFHQVPSGIILQSKAVGAPAAPQTSASLGPLGSPTASGLVSGQAPSGTSTAPSHAPAPAPVATAGLPPLLPAESKAFASNLPTLTVAKAAASGPGKSSGLQYECKLSSLKKPPTLQPSKEACFLEHLHKHQGSVLHPDYKTAFPSFEDALHRLLPYHVYQGALPSPNDYHKVDEEFETVSTQLLKRTQAMLNKYRLLLLEESRRVSPSAEMVMIDRMFIQEEKTTLALDKQLAKEKPDEYVSSSRSLGLPLAASSEGHRLPSHGPSPSSASGAPTQPPLHLPTKLVIRHGGAGGSPSVSWARASSSSLSSSALSSAASSLDADEDGPMPSRNRPPIKTYEARSRIGLKLKIKQEAGLSKVVHNTALDPVHQTPPPPPAALKAAEPPPRPPPPPPATGQMNGTVDHPPPPAAADRKPPAPAPHCPRLPLRKTYRENVEASGGGAAEGAAAGRARGGSPAPLPTKVDEATSGLIRELAAVEDELYQRMLKGTPAEPAAGAGQGSGSREPGWEAPPLPPAKRRKSESPDVDQASFSSDSPQDDTLTEHLQSAIDSILNLQQAPGRTPAPPYPHAAPAAVTPASPTPLHRPEAYPPSSHNGGLGARTLNR
ncbi:BRD4-interacting chromatin-remodeling complex-associated protein isoform X4 [Tursiops truncatus]|uniref:BRD4-interacting chromatin-remodeling complex-associated protein isoform X4 n=1 Tax=Tursiops truncatus TaxID=9739 RepID=UPI003CCFB436